MADNSFKIVARLDINESAEVIKTDIKTLEKIIQSDKNTRLKIIAGLEIGKSKKLIQSQLATIANQANAPTIKVGVDVDDHKTGQGIVDELQNVQTKAQKTVNQIKSSLLELTSEKIRKIQFDIGADEEGFFNFQKTIENAKNAISEIGNFKNVDISWGLNKDTGEIEKIVTTITDARGVTESFIYDLQKLGNAFSYAGGSGTDKGVRTLIEAQRKHSQEIENTRAKYTRLFEDFKNSNSAIESGLTEPIKNFQAILNGLGSTSSISDVKNEFESLKKAASEINKYLDTTNNSFNKSTNAINHYKNMDNIIKDLSISFDNLSIKPQDLSTKIDTVKTHLIELQEIEAQNGTDLSWAEKYREVNLELSEIETSIKLAQKAEKSDKNSSYQVQSKYLAKIKDEISTIVGYKKKLVSAGEEEVQVYQREIDLALNRIGYAESQLKKKNLLTDEAKAYIDTLKNELTIQEKINAAKTNDKANSQFQNDFNKYSQDLQRQIDTLNRLYNSPIFNNNSSNNAVISQRQRISELLAEYTELKSKLSSDIDPKGLESIGTSLNKLKIDFDIVEDETNQLKTSLTRSVGDEKLRQNIDGLTARINVFRQSNSKAEKQFGSVLDGMLADLKECGDSNTYQKINKQFQIIQNTVKATGKTGKTFFEKLKEQAEKFSSWMSLTGLITSAWHDLQKMVTNVIEIDSTMTNLKKVTDETEASYARFLKNSTKEAQNLHATVTDLIEQVATWSKLGFSLQDSENLAKVSMIYSKVGEVDNTRSVSDLVTVMKAFNIESGKSITIVDALNQLGNNFATDAASLGEGLTKSASALNAANNSFEQSIALLTGGTEITQNANEMGSALKVISMRIRGKLYASI